MPIDASDNGELEAAGDDTRSHRSLAGASLAQALHDGYTDLLSVPLPV